MTNNARNHKQRTGLSRFPQRIRREFVDNPIASTGAAIGIAVGCLALCAAAWAVRWTLGLVIIPAIFVVVEALLCTKRFRFAAKSRSQAEQLRASVWTSFVGASSIAIAIGFFLAAATQTRLNQMLPVLPESEELAGHLAARQQSMFSADFAVYYGILFLALGVYIVLAYFVISLLSAPENNTNDPAQSEGGDPECL